MARGKQSRGLGDTIAKITELTKLDKLVNEDCGCEERKEKLNKLFKYRVKVINCPNEADEKWYLDFKKNRTLTISDEQRKNLCRIYAEVFNTPYFEPCVNCSPKPYILMIEKLDEIIL